MSEATGGTKPDVSAEAAQETGEQKSRAPGPGKVGACLLRGGRGTRPPGDGGLLGPGRHREHRPARAPAERPGRDDRLLRGDVCGDAGHALRGAGRGRGAQSGGGSLARDRHVLRRAFPGHRAHGRARGARGHRSADDRGRQDRAQRRLLRQRRVRARRRVDAATAERDRAAHGGGLQHPHALAAALRRAVGRPGRRGRVDRARWIPDQEHATCT